MQGLKVLISHATTYKKGGWGRIFPIAVGLAKLGHHVTILTTNPEFSILRKKQTLKNVTVIIFPEIVPARITRLGFGLLSLFLKILHVLSNKYDIVHSDNGHRPLSGVPCRISKKMHGTVYVAEWYDWYGRGGQYDSKKWLFKILLGKYEIKYEIRDKETADGVVVLSEVLRARAETFKKKDRIIKIHGGADVSVIPFLYDNSELKQKYGLDKDTLTLGYVNSQSYRLGEFIPLLNALNENSFIGKIKILVFGDSGLLLAQLDPVVVKQIQFFGWVDFSQDFEKLHLVDVFFLFKEEILGNRSGWPNCIGDYLACGRPILCNPVGEIVDFAAKYPFAFIETTRSAADIAAKIRIVLDNRHLLKEKGPLIRDLAEKVVSWDKKSEELAAFYKYLKGIKDESDT